jgi:hypothetical protein
MPPSPWTPSRLQRSSLTHTKLQNLTRTTKPKAGFPLSLGSTILLIQIKENEFRSPDSSGPQIALR